ncbi:MAG TPA: hypothetical protein VF281_04700 [Candidatus Saccharimonadales bacterium]
MSSYSSGSSSWVKGLVGTIVVLGLLAAIYWFFVGFWFDSAAQVFRGFLNGIWFSWLFPNGWNIFMATPLFTVLVCAVIIFIAWIIRDVNESSPVVAGILTTVLVIVSLHAIFIRGVWETEEKGARHYLQTTTFVVHDPNKMPDMLTKFGESNETFVKVVAGDLPSGWLSRVASATGARNVISKTGDAISNTELMLDTMTYIYGEGQTGTWTAIRDGKNQVNIYGVASWDGSGESVKTCEFTGDNELNRAFGGMWGTNLTNAIAGKYPLFTYDESDIWGYCDGDKPVIVIPGTKTVGYSTRTVDQANGVVTVVGSPSGEPVIEHDESVDPGEYPGPVYPQRLVNQQLSGIAWAAGRHLRMFENFGLETTSVSSQEGNNKNFLLKSATDGRLYWVTPLRPRSTDSQTLIAYSVTPADSIKTDQLNEQKVYILDSNDPRIVNLDNLQAKVIDKVRTTDPGFFTGDSPGKIVEFLPVADDKWQVFAEVNGRVKYRIDVNVGAQITASVVSIDKDQPQTGETGSPTSVTMTCDDPSSLDDARLAQCLAGLANELQKRQSEPAK